MSLKFVIFVLLIVILCFFNVQSVGNFPQPGNIQGSTSQQNIQQQSEEVARTSHQQELQKILKYLDQNRRDEEDFRKREQFIQGQLSKQQRLNDQLRLDNLELKVREQIEYFLNMYAHRQPLNIAYMQQLNVFNKDLGELKSLIYRMADDRVQEIRLHDKRQIEFYQQQLMARRVLELNQFIEVPPKDLTTKLERAMEQKKLKDIDNLLQDNLRRLSNWHAKNQLLNDAYNQITYNIKQNFEDFTSIKKQIDQRRMKERQVEVREIADLKENLRLRWEFELKERKQEQPTNDEKFEAQRIKDELEEDYLYQYILQRHTILEKQLEENFPFNKDYILQKKLLNQDVLKIYARLENNFQRRWKKQKTQSMQKSKSSECLNVQFCEKPQ